MMTNLIASITVTVATNTAVIQPMKQVPAPCPDKSMIGCLVMHWQSVPDESATNRTVETKAIETTILRFDWHGAREVKQERVIWATQAVERLEWRKP